MMIDISKGILDLANEIAGRYDEPVPLLQVAENEFIEVVCDDYGKSSFDGLTWFEAKTDDFYIHLNTNTSRNNNPKSTKGSFTLAHELGHYFIPYHRLGLMRGLLKPHGSLSYYSNQYAWHIEREADAFASTLLMPTKSIIDFVKGEPFCFELIEDIAEEYKVSKSAAALRYVDIGDTPIMVVFAVDGRISWASKSEAFPFRRMRYGSSKNDRVPENTVMGTYFYDKDDSDCRSEQIVFAGDCFETRYKEDNKREFIEWCIGYKNLALSVFWENV